MSRSTDPWDLLLVVPEHGWIVLTTRRWLSLVQLAAFGLVAVEVAAPGVYQVRLTAAGRLYRSSLLLGLAAPEVKDTTRETPAYAPGTSGPAQA